MNLSSETSRTHRLISLPEYNASSLLQPSSFISRNSESRSQMEAQNGAPSFEEYSRISRVFCRCWEIYFQTPRASSTSHLYPLRGIPSHDSRIRMRVSRRRYATIGVYRMCWSSHLFLVSLQEVNEQERAEEMVLQTSGASRWFSCDDTSRRSHKFPFAGKESRGKFHAERRYCPRFLDRDLICSPFSPARIKSCERKRIEDLVAIVDS